MEGFDALIKSLRRAEQQLEKQLSGVRKAISSLEFGGAVSPSLPRFAGRRSGVSRNRMKRRRMSAAARAKISARMKRYWAGRKKASAKVT